MHKEETIKKIKDLLDNVQKAYDSINAKEGKHPAFAKWVKIVKLRTGFIRSNLQIYTNYFNHKVIPSLENDEFARAYDFENDKKRLHLFDFLKFCNEYLESLRPKDLSNRVWFFYFLNIGEDARDYPRLGRGVLFTSSNNRTFLKMPEKGNKEFVGIYEKLSDNVYFFEFKTLIPHDCFHIKVSFNNAEHGVILGCYSTFDNRIYTGSCVLHQQSEVKNPSTLEAFYCSKKELPECYGEVPPSIREYLSIKKRNYYKAPKNSFVNADALKTYVSRTHKLELRDIENRFLEMRKPVVYISSPKNSLLGSPSEVSEIKKVISSFVEKLEADKRLKDFTFIYDNKNDESIKPEECFKHLERTRYYILIHPKTEKTSLSLVSFSWALNFSKNILIIHQENSMSDSFKHLDTFFRKINRKSFPSLLIQEEQEDIYSTIFNFIDKNRLDKDANYRIEDSRL